MKKINKEFLKDIFINDSFFLLLFYFIAGFYLIIFKSKDINIVKFYSILYVIVVMIQGIFWGYEIKKIKKEYYEDE